MSGGPTQAQANGELAHRPMRSRGFKTCLPASGPRPGTLAVGKDQIRSLDRTKCFLASDRAYTNQQHLSWLCILFLSSPKQVCTPSTQMGEAQEAEDEGASSRLCRYPRSRYRPDGTRRRTAGELRARGARNQWPPSTSQNRRGADNRPRGQQARDHTQSRQPRAQANQWRHRGQRQDEHRDYGWRNWDSRSRVARLAGKRTGSGPGNTEAAIVAGTGPATGAAVAAGPTTLDGQTPPGISSRLKDTEALPTLKR